MPDLEISSFYCKDRTFNDDFSDPNLEAHYPPDLELEPIHLNIDLFFDLDAKSASGSVTTTVRAHHDGPRTLKLDAVDFQDVKVRDPDGRKLSWDYDGSKLVIHWEQPFAQDEERRVEVAYRVDNPVAGLYFSRPDQAYPDQPWYVSSDHETERARYWLPCIDLPNVRTALDFYLRAEDRFTILANGYLVEEETHTDGTKTAHWKLEQLCPSYLICVAIGDFVRAEDGAFEKDGRSVPVAYFGTPEHSTEDLLRTFGRTKPMLAWMTKKLDMPFPYPKYYQYALPGIYGAMENISLVSWNDSWVQDKTLAKEISFWVDMINLHEMSHSYFGDAVVCRDFAHAWLKESWATYMPQVYCDEAISHDEALYTYYRNATRYFKEADEKYKRPIVTRRFKSSWQMYDAHLYPGGACRLHTLRNELGDRVFWEAVRDYLKRYYQKVVETDDFRHVLEEHSGRSLGKFFDQWFYTAGYPSLKITFKYDEENKLGTFTIEQTQVDKEKGIPAFELHTDLSWTIDGKEHHLPITLNEQKHVIIVEIPSKPEMVRFDPDCKVLHKLDFNPGDPMLRAQLTQAKDVVGRIQAAHELAKTGKRANIQAIVDAYRNEPYWGVRVEFARALGKANTETAIAGLAEIIAMEQDPMVMEGVFMEAGNYRDLRIRDALAARLNSSHAHLEATGKEESNTVILPYLAERAAYKAMGAQREKADWELLLEGAEHDGYHGFAQSGAFQGLASTRRQEAIGLLMEKVVYGACTNRARPAAVSALADIGKGQEKLTRERIIEIIIDLLRDPWDRVRGAAAQGLGTMKATEAIPDLEAYTKTLPFQDQVEVEKIISSLRQEDKLDGSAIKKQVEDLQEKLRKLEDQVQQLEAKIEPKNPEG